MIELSVRRLVTALFCAAAAAGFFYLLIVVFPSAPSRVPMAVGFKGGTYEIFFAGYQKQLAQHGVVLEYRTTGGAVENQNLLNDPTADVQVGFVQGGIANSQDAPDLVSLGRVAYQPFYLFYRTAQPIHDLSDLKGRKVAIGAPGNGSAVAAKKILAAAGVTANNTIFLPQFAKAAIDALRSGEVDAVFEAFSNEPVVRAALRDPNIGLLSIRGADALTHLFPFLSKIVLPQGVIDYEHNIPPSDITLISTTVGVLARKDLHPAVITLLASGLMKTHGNAGLFERAGEFPTHTDPEYPMAPAAQDYYRNGPSFLNQYIPFWITHSAQRVAVVMFAAFGIIFPIARYVPQLRNWWFRRRVEQWYEQLEDIEASLASQIAPDRLPAIKLALDAIEAAERSSRLPPSFGPQRFSLRGHIQNVRRKADELSASQTGSQALSGSGFDGRQARHGQPISAQS